MGRRMSNRDRIARMAEERAARAREKDRKRESPADAPAPARAPRKPKGAVRMKIVWTLCDPNGKVLKTYPYPEKAAAESDAAKLAASKGAEYRVKPHKVPMEE
ncbi:MAG: hypothetical protein ACREID_09695 [Planctomycetota bacterium]